MFSMKISFQISEIDPAQALADEVGVEVTAVDGRDLHHRDVLFRDRVGVVARGRVPIENRDSDFVLQHLDQLRDQGGLAGTDRAHEVDRGDAVLVEERAIFPGQFFVRFEQAMLQLDVVDLVR